MDSFDAPNPFGCRHRLFLIAAATLAVVPPTLVAFNVAPSATFLNQVAAFVGWGGFLLVLSLQIPRHSSPRSPASLALAASLLLLTAAACAASIWRGTPWSLSLSAALTIVSALLASVVGAAASQAGRGDSAFGAFCVALAIAGVLSALIGLVQVIAPALPDGDWIAASAMTGRATGNLRQPNHLSSLLLWSVVAVMWLGEVRKLRWIVWTMMLVFIEVIVLSASRTGLLGMFVLTTWGILDRQLSRSTRYALLAAPVAYLALWGLTDVWAHATGMAFGGGERLSGSGLYVSNSRYKIWWNSLALIAAHPWLGVGFGEFNFAWTLTPFPDRPVAFFDHAHNIVLQFAVELGLPLAALVLALLIFAFYCATKNALIDRRTPAGGAGVQRAALVMVLMAGVHSLLEYPLWYAYFLLPAAFAFGLCLERPREQPASAMAGPVDEATRPFVLASMAMIVLGFLALHDYWRVAVIFSPPDKAGPLAQRIADGRRSVLFAHHADYAVGTMEDHPGKVISAFMRAPHYLLDTRLMMAWARALEETDQDDKARYVAARLKEFHNSDSDEFFAPCTTFAASTMASAPTSPIDGKPPFQCLPPRRTYSYEDFR